MNVMQDQIESKENSLPLRAKNVVLATESVLAN